MKIIIVLYEMKVGDVVIVFRGKLELIVRLKFGDVYFLVYFFIGILVYNVEL